MPQYPRAQFVSGPSPDATVLYDFNDDTTYTGVRTWVLEDGWSIGVPSLEGFLDGVGAEYGPRTLTFTQAVDGSKAHALAKHSALARQILRDGNWLLFQLSAATNPVWFHTYRTQPGELSFGQVASGAGKDRWRIAVQLTAEPFALGARVILPSVEVTNDPAASTNPMGFLLPAIVGDAPAPLRISAAFSAAMDVHDIAWTVVPVPADYAPIVWPIGTGDSFTAGTDTGAGVADAAFSGGSYRAVTFATDGDLATRLSGPVAGPVPPGRYRVYARVARTNLDSTYTLRLGTHDAVFGDSVDGAETVTVSPSSDGVTGPTHATYVDLGVRSYPSHLTELDVTGLNYTPQIALQVARTAGTGNLNLDCLILVPVTLKGIEGAASTLTSEFPVFGPRSDDEYAMWDGDLEAFVRKNGVGAVDSSVQPINRGGFPVAVPGATNALHLITQTRTREGFFGATAPDTIASTTDVAISYHPRFLWIGDT